MYGLHGQFISGNARFANSFAVPKSGALLLKPREATRHKGSKLVLGQKRTNIKTNSIHRGFGTERSYIKKNR